MSKEQRSRSNQVYHIVACKQGNPSVYYYRQWIERTSWTAWTKIDLDIVSDHVLPIVWNRRLYLFWAIINRKPNKEQSMDPIIVNVKSDDKENQNQTTSTNLTATPADVKTHLEVKLAWSELKGKKWLPKQTAPQTIVIQKDNNWDIVDPEPHMITLKSRTEDSLIRIDIFVTIFNRTSHGLGTTYSRHYGEFVFRGDGNSVEAFVCDSNDITGVGPDTRNIGVLSDELNLVRLVPPEISKFDAMTVMSTDYYFRSVDRPRISICSVSYNDGSGNLKTTLVLETADFYHLLVPHQTRDLDSTHPFFYNDSLRSYFIIPNNKNLDTKLAKIEYTFVPFYHPFVSLFIREISGGGVDLLFSRDLQNNPASLSSQILEFDFNTYYNKHSCVINNPMESVDFELNASYSIYNWELFFHAPFMIGEALSLNQRFEDAKHWYEYIFNPTSNSDDEVPKRYWVTKPFYNYKMEEILSQNIQNLMDLISNNDQNTCDQVKKWQNDPYNTHNIAQLRPVAYMRTIVMKYIDNLIAWGDQLFSQGTVESVNEATQMYILAAELMGPRPEEVKPLQVPSDLTYDELENLEKLLNQNVQAAENLLPPLEVSDYFDHSKQKMPSFFTQYFRIPPNEQLLKYWDTVADRLFKIRHCMNIKGEKIQLPLFSPPINPALLVKAAASGIDLDSIFNDTNPVIPPYRFRVIVNEAITFCELVRSFGNELLGALEKSDAECLALKRSGNEKKLQEQMLAVMQNRLNEAKQQVDVLKKQRDIIVERQSFYGQRKDMLFNAGEAEALYQLASSLIEDDLALYNEINATNDGFLPNLQFGASGGGGSPHATAVWGSSNIVSSESGASNAARIRSAILQTKAHMSQTLGSYLWRKDDWELQYNLATDELAANNSQILAASIRQDITQNELDNQDINIKLATEVDDFLHSKYTNQELYKWMISQTSATYFQAYQIAYTLAKRAEQCFRQELGLSESSYVPYIQFGYWDSLKKGLSAGDKLLFDLQRLKSAYYTQNTRELELTKHISLLALDPYALVELRSKGECKITLPEILFDLENPGHYMRRIKSVGITVPCVVGPYTGVSMTVTLLDNHTRIKSDAKEYAFYPKNDKDLSVFVNDQGGISAIVTSSAHNDKGLFEFRFDDDRYLPFEFNGAISSWKLQLNPVYPQLDHSTISDVIIHLQYTARYGGDDLKTAAIAAVKAKLNDFALAENRNGLSLLMTPRHDFGANWQKFLNPNLDKDQMLTFDLLPDRFPFFTHGLNIKIKGIDFAAKLSDSYTIVVTPPDKSVHKKPMVKTDQEYLHHCCIDGSGDSPLKKIELGSTLEPKQNLKWSFQFQKDDYPVKLSESDIDDLLLVIHYEVQKPEIS